MINETVKVLVGRNAGEYGKVVAENNHLVYVDFVRYIVTNEGFGSYSEYYDGYW